MSDTERKAIILNKLSSPYISEAIIILKDGVCAPQSKVIEDAELIVSSYIRRTSKNGQPPEKTARTHTWKLTAILCLGAALTSFCISFFSFR